MDICRLSFPPGLSTSFPKVTRPDKRNAGGYVYLPYLHAEMLKPLTYAMATGRSLLEPTTQYKNLYSYDVRFFLCILIVNIGVPSSIYVLYDLSENIGVLFITLGIAASSYYVLELFAFR